MSRKSIERIIGKIVLDSGFRDNLLADPERALAGFQLTTAEKADLKRMDAETLDLLANILAARTSQWQVDSIFPLDQKQEGLINEPLS